MSIIVKLRHNQLIHNIFKLSLIFSLSIWTIIREQRPVQIAIESGILLNKSSVQSSATLATELALAPPTILHFISSVLVIIFQDVTLASFVLLFASLTAYFLGLYLIATALGLPKLLVLIILFLTSTFNDFFEDYFINVYPFEIDSIHSWGQFGISFSILLIGLVSRQKIKISILTAVLLLSFQVLWGLWTISIIILVLAIIHYKNILSKFGTKKIIIACTTLIFFLLLILTLRIHLINNLTVTPNLLTYYQLWDYHRGHTYQMQSIVNSIILIPAIIVLYTIQIKKTFSINFLSLFFLFSITLSVTLYLLQEKSSLIHNSIITFMVGRFFNLHAAISFFIFTCIIYLSLNILIKKTLHINSKTTSMLSTLIVGLCSLLLYQQFSFLLTPNNFSELKDNIKRNLRHSYPNYCDKLVEGNVLAIGWISKSMITDCGVAPMLDTNQTDTVAGSEVLVSKLKDYTEELYGIDFENPSLEALNQGLVFSRSGGIPQDLVEKVWSLRTLNEWNYLICKHKINQIIISKNSYLNFSDHFKSNGYRFYNVECTNNNDAELPNTRFFSKIPIEYYNSGKYFFWITDDNNQISLQNLQSKLLRGELKFRATPNPCKITNKINVIQTDFNHILYDIKIKNSPAYFSFPLVIQPEQQITLEFARDAGQICKVDGDIRDFVFEISEIEFIEK